MRVSKEKAAESRRRIIEAAGRLFRENGFDGISVADIMAAADLTHGGFYGHFESKDALAAQASRTAFDKSVESWERLTANAGNPYETLVEHYLRPRHAADPGTGCALATLGADAARQGKPVRDTFGDGLNRLVDILARSIPDASKPVRRRKALAAMAQLAGALMLSRAVADKALADEILKAAKMELLAG